jgi:hypothetical protein
MIGLGWSARTPAKPPKERQMSYARRHALIGSDRDAPGIPLLRYFITVGAALAVGLLALGTYLGPASADRAAKVSKASSSTATLVKVWPPRPGAS